MPVLRRRAMPSDVELAKAHNALWEELWAERRRRWEAWDPKHPLVCESGEATDAEKSALLVSVMAGRKSASEKEIGDIFEKYRLFKAEALLWEFVLRGLSTIRMKGGKVLYGEGAVARELARQNPGFLERTS